MLIIFRLWIKGENCLVKQYLLVMSLVHLFEITDFSLIFDSEGVMPLMNIHPLDLLPILSIIMGVLFVIQFLYFYVIKKRLRKGSEEKDSEEKDSED